MSLGKKTRQFFTALALILVLATTSACQANQTKAKAPTALNPSVTYQQLERGNTASGQEFGNWVVQTAKGLISDAYVRDNNKLGIVITPQVRPPEVIAYLPVRWNLNCDRRSLTLSPRNGMM
ncbi:hypothetical protein MC7420_1231 [Coleofasciculus chthonoplastes PCC 7420]|uniref:Uncharacterized protein n=1 Tax=Coleofasciculus chthonoplastes PCC 7420 TaxID=118168 RepID=B4W5G7_9CYAN|nr:hypothetical protein [Coleofasciculus chthonoplastes]EDX70569.1 hypothetical protein MC7420_1231 [Coleofasciculus chthonoplastes PCC 7420]